MNNRFMRGSRGVRLGIATASLLALVASSANAATLSGNIINSGGGHGLYYVFVIHLGIVDPLAGTDVLTTAGHWEVNGVSDGTYFVLAYRDINANLIPGREEPMGFFGSPLPKPVVISGGQSVAGVDVSLQQVNAAAELLGKVTYAGQQQGRIWVLPHLGPDFEFLNVRGIPATITEPGAYQSFALQSGEYFVTAYMDVNGNLMHDEGEPIGTSRAVTVDVTPGVTYSNIDIALTLNSTAVEEKTWSKVKSLYQK